MSPVLNCFWPPRRIERSDVLIGQLERVDLTGQVGISLKRLYMLLGSITRMQENRSELLQVLGVNQMIALVSYERGLLEMASKHAKLSSLV